MGSDEVWPMGSDEAAFRQRFEKWKEGADERREVKKFKQMHQLEKESLKNKKEFDQICSEIMCGLIVVGVVVGCVLGLSLCM